MMASPLLAFELIGFYGVFAVCFWLGLIFAIISGLTSGMFHDIHAGDAHIGGDAGGDVGHADTGGVGGHTVPDFPAFSPVTISTFVTVFGGTGMVFSKIPATSEAYFSVPLALLCAFIGAYGVFLMFSRVFYAVQSSSEVVQGQLVGQTATVITSVPVNGMGEIVYVGSGGRQNAQARSADAEAIPAGAEVVITKIVGGSFYVSRNKPNQ